MFSEPFSATKEEVVSKHCKSYQPRTCPVTPYSTPRPTYNTKQNQSKSKKANEIADQLKWLRSVSSTSYQAPTAYSSFSRPSSRYSRYSFDKSANNQFAAHRKSRYRRPMSSQLSYRSRRKTEGDDQEKVTRPQTAKLMISNKMMATHRSHTHHLSTATLNGAEDGTETTFSAWTLKEKGKRNFVFDHPDDSEPETNTDDITVIPISKMKDSENSMDSDQDSETKRKTKPVMDVLDINTIDSQNTEMLKHWKTPKNTMNRQHSVSSIESGNVDDIHSSVHDTKSYLTNTERIDYETRSVLQNANYKDHLYTARPKYASCSGMTFRDFEKLNRSLEIRDHCASQCH